MQHWCSATAISTSLESKLKAAGLSEVKQIENKIIDPSNCLLIYAVPDVILADWRKRLSTCVKSIELDSVFKTIKKLGEHCQYSCAEWRLNKLDTTSILRMKQGMHPWLDASISPPDIQPLAGILTTKIIKEYPEILETYQDLELKSLLFGLDADSRYMRRLEDSSAVNLALQDWWYKSREQEGTFEEIEATLAQLQQCQYDYEQLIRKQEKLRSTISNQNSINLEILTKLAKSKKWHKQ